MHNYTNSSFENIQLSSSQVSAAWNIEDSSISMKVNNITAIFLICFSF